MKVKLIIFDFDGTLMDTKRTIVAAKQELMRQMGRAVPSEQACLDTIGLSAQKGFQKLCPDFSEEMIEQCMNKYRTVFEETRKTVPSVLFPNVRETLDKLKEKGIVCTIATARGRDSLTEFLDRNGILERFSYILAAEDTTLLKPNPEPVLKTLQDLNCPADAALVVGDMPYDILMGKNAGVRTCGVTYGVSGRESLAKAGADDMIDDISELLKIADS